MNIKTKIPPKQSSQKKSSQKISPKKIPQKNSQRIPKKINFSKNFSDFESVQFPSSHLEAENPFGLVLVQTKVGLCTIVSTSANFA